MFDPRWWTHGGRARLALVVREKRTKVEILHLSDSGLFRVRDVPKGEVQNMRRLDYGARQERKMKSTIRRIARKPGTPKNAREAARSVVA